MEIREEIETKTGRDVSYGAVYTTLKRLSTKGWVTHELGESTPEHGGERVSSSESRPRAGSRYAPPAMRCRSCGAA